jgi:DNA-binding NarL/FixJ family response regulator
MSVVSEPPLEARLRLLESGEQVAKLGSWEWSPGTDEQLWSDNLYRIFGLEPGEMTPTREFVLGRTHQDDRERVAKYVEMTRLVADPPPIVYRIEQPERGFRYVRSTITAPEPGTPDAKRIVGTVQDVTDQVRAEREIEAHLALDQVLVEWDTLEQGAELLLQSLAQVMDFDAGVFWLPRENALAPVVSWSAGTLDAVVLESNTKPLRLPAEEHLPAQVWEDLEPALWVANPRGEAHPRRQAAVRAGLRSAIAFPAIGSEEVVAVIELFARREFEPTRRSARSLSAIGRELGRFLEGSPGEPGPKLLTPREIEVLQLAANGATGREIAAALEVGPATVKTHFEHIYTKLNVSGRAPAVAIGVRQGLIA